MARKLKDNPDQTMLFDANEQQVRLLTVDEIYTRATQGMLSVIEEDCRIERKPCGIHRHELADYFSMWANTPPDGGIIAIGVSDKGKMLGCNSLTQNQINNLETAGDLCPDARFQFKRLDVKNDAGTDDFVMLIRVP